MRRETEVCFREVRAGFLRENPEDLCPQWPLGALDIANRQFGCWMRVFLDPEDILSVMLPRHDHCVDLVSGFGGKVSEAIERLRLVPESAECRQRIHFLSAAPISSVFLSAAPIDDPSYPDYKGLVGRGHRGLTHLDGLHRMIAWGREGRSDVRAYVAGLI